MGSDVSVVSLRSNEADLATPIHAIRHSSNAQSHFSIRLASKRTLPPSHLRLHALAVFFLFASLPAAILSRIFSRSLSSFSLVISTLLGATPMGTLWPLLFSRLTRSMWTTYLRR